MSQSPREQAERILRTIREERPETIPASVDVEDVEEAIDPSVPDPVNLRRVLEQLNDAE